MFGSSQGDGIQALLAAEQEAQQIVGEARRAKAERLRQAREEAEKEAAAYRQQREEHFARQLQAQTGDSSSVTQQLEAETARQVQQIQACTQKQGGEVSSMLLTMVTTVK
mmetsp:Transcript_4916/g.17840  ORF Transcript_4916/g.17840 Transcript_4916/m.17840 type:complete len:110 (-) Transcript_4916:1612-1941(-)